MNYQTKAEKDPFVAGEVPPKVLFVVNSLDVGGIETYLLRFLHYTGAAIDATVLCKSGRGGALIQDYQDIGAKIVFLELGTSISPRYLQLSKIIRAEKFQSVCDFTGDFAGFVMLTANLAGIRTRIAFYRGSEYQFRPTLLRRGFARFMSWLTRSNASRILSNSQVALDRFQPTWKVRRDRYRVVRNPAPEPTRMSAERRIELRRAAGLPHDAFVISHVGRVTPAKNHEVVLDVILAALERHPNVWAVLIGLGTREFCESRLPNAIAGRLKTFEYRSDVVDFLQACDLFLFPSLNEGMPNAMIEAMAAGCPVLATDIPAIKEVFPPKYDSYLFPPTEPSEATKKIERMIARPDPTYGLYLAEWVQGNFGIDATFGEFLSELNGSNRRKWDNVG